jgi:hypothetical protein
MKPKRGWVDELAEPSDALTMQAVARELSLLSPAAFARRKANSSAGGRARAKGGKTTDDAVTEIWAAPATLAYIRDYVTRTLGKG